MTIIHKAPNGNGGKTVTTIRLDLAATILALLCSIFFAVEQRRTGAEEERKALLDSMRTLVNERILQEWKTADALHKAMDAISQSQGERIKILEERLNRFRDEAPRR